MLNDEALNATEVASILHIGRNAVYELAKSGALPSYRMGRKILFALKDVETYLASVRTANVGVDVAGGGPTDAPSAPAPTPLEGFVFGGNGAPAALLVERLEAIGEPCSHANLTSYEALCALYDGRASAAVVHLYDQRTNSYNIPYVQRLVPGTPVLVVRLVKRMQGLIVAKGNPKALSTWGALLKPDVRLANRLRGCGARVLLDEKLLAMEAIGARIAGYADSFASGLLAAQAVANGAADVAVAGAHVAAHVNRTEFVPLQGEWLDLVIVKTDETRELIRRIHEMLSDDAFRAEYARMVHGDPASLGAIVYDC